MVPLAGNFHVLATFPPERDMRHAVVRPACKQSRRSGSRARSHERYHMPRPDRPTGAPTSSGSAPGPGAAAPTIVARARVAPAEVRPTGQPPRPASRATAAKPEGGDAPKQGARDRERQHPHLGADLQAAIGQQLRGVYHEILNEPVPDRFVRLLEELAAKTADQA
jgi:Anti-sigma factor NepR